MSQQPGKHGYPLAALFVLIAVCGILTALLGPVLRAVTDGYVGLDELSAAAFGSIIALGIVGTFVGLYHHQPAWGAGIGCGTGGVVGLMVGPLLFTPYTSFPHLIAASLGGSVALLLIGAIVRLATRQRER